jgi:hypothetical protein
VKSLLALLVLGSVATAAPSRADFAKKLATIKPGLPADKVKQLLGPPDDIKTERDPGGITAARTVEIWRYGSSAHGAFATLGAVHMLANKTVQYAFGGGAPGAGIAGIAETDLRKLLELLDAVPSYNDMLEPLALIQAVNALQPLGKDKALAVIEEYLRVANGLDNPGREGVFLVLRTLFTTTGNAPDMAVGAPSPVAQNPIVIINDLPLKIVRGYMLAGHPEQPESDVAAYKKVGTLRTKPLAPSVASLDAIDAQLVNIKDDSHRAYIYDQALRAFGTVYRPGNMTVDSWFPEIKDIANRWKVVRGEIAKTGATWNASANRFELAKGAVLAPLPGGFSRVWWDATLPGASKARLTFQRLTDKLVTIEWRVELNAGARLVADRIVLTDATTGKRLAELPYDALSAPPAQTAGSVSTRRIEIPRGTSVKPELGGVSGPWLKP